MQVVYECENCGHEHDGYAYDDEHFHKNVIPDKVCPKCGEKAPDTYRPLTTKYREDEVV